MTMDNGDEHKMYGWEKIASACGMGCKVFLSPWANPEKAPYDAVLKDDDDVTDTTDSDKMPVTTEPRVPNWGDMSISAPIVKNKSNSNLNSRNLTASYDKLPATTGSVPKLNNKRLSKPDLAGSRGSLTGSKTSLTGSTESNEVLQVREMVTTV